MGIQRRPTEAPQEDLHESRTAQEEEDLPDLEDHYGEEDSDEDIVEARAIIPDPAAAVIPEPAAAAFIGHGGAQYGRHGAELAAAEGHYVAAISSWSHVPAVFRYYSTHGDSLDPYASSSSGSSNGSESDPTSPRFDAVFPLALHSPPGSPAVDIPDVFTFPTPAPISVLSGAASHEYQPQEQSEPSPYLPPPPDLLTLAERRTGRRLYFSMNSEAPVPRQPHWNNPDAHDPMSFIASLRQPLLTSNPRFHFVELPELDPNSFTLRLQSPHQLTHTNVVFYIEASLSLCDASYFNIRVTSPSGFNPQVTVELDVNYQKRYICTFEALEPGIYHISVLLEEPESNHITGSPSIVCISRNYLADSGMPIMTRILTAGRLESDAPGVYVSQTSKIWGITNNPDTEKIYAADRDGQEILVFSTARGQITLEDKFTARIPRNGKPFRPTGIDFSRQSQLLYVTDKDNHRVCIFKSGGLLISTFGSQGYDEGQFSFPWGVAVSPDGELVAVADSKNHRVQLFNKYGLYLRKYTVFERNPFLYRHPSHGLDYPRGICFGGGGEAVFVSDFNLHNVIAFDQNMRNRTILCPLRRLLRPQGLAMDPGGSLLLCDSRSLGGGCIRVLRPGGVLVATLEGTSEARFEVPVDITICRGGYVCVVDMGGKRIQIF